MFLPNPGILAAGAGISVPYATWLAYVTAKPGVTARAWRSSNVVASGLYRVTCNATDDISTDTLYGSSWVSTFRLQSGLSYTSRIVQHALPSEAQFNAQRTAGKVVLMEMSAVSTAEPALSRNRNGFVSTADGLQQRTIPMIAWHDEGLQQVMMSNPYLGTDPVPYSAADWNPA